MITKTAFIVKTPNGKWTILSQKGKQLGVYPTKAEAVKRLRQIEFFKAHPKKKTAAEKMETIDLSDLKELAYSAVMRELRQQCEEETVREFQIAFKRIFDALVLNGQEHPAEKAMPAAIILFGRQHHLKLNGKEK